MKLVSNQSCNAVGYYLPHNGVFRNNGTKKIRVVFNSSQNRGNSLSSNDVLLPGPKLESEVYE